MNKEQVSDPIVVLSEKEDEEEAAREVCLKVKALLPKGVKLMLIFFTSHYRASLLRRNIDVLLLPENILGIQSSSLIFEDKVIKRGIIGCCFARDGLGVEESLLTDVDYENVELILRRSMLRLGGERSFTLSSLSPSVELGGYLRGVELFLKSAFKVLGIGFVKGHNSSIRYIVNSIVGKGLATIFLKGNIDVELRRVGGFLPLGRDFTITRVSEKGDIILEIENQPACFLYKRYLQEKFDFLKKTYLFQLYPLGVRVNGEYKLINVMEILDDGSLLCLGKVAEGERCKVMIGTRDTLIAAAKKEAGYIKNNFSPCLVLLLYSLFRRDILKREAEREIKIIKEILGKNFIIIGLYCDYLVTSLPGLEEYTAYTVEGSSLSLILIK